MRTSTEIGFWLALVGLIIVIGLFMFPVLGSAIGILDGQPLLAPELGGFLLLAGIPILLVGALMRAIAKRRQWDHVDGFRPSRDGGFR